MIISHTLVDQTYRHRLRCRSSHTLPGYHAPTGQTGLAFICSGEIRLSAFGGLWWGRLFGGGLLIAAFIASSFGQVNYTTVKQGTVGVHLPRAEPSRFGYR